VGLQAKAVRETHKEAHLKSLLATGKHLGPLSQEEQLACLADLRAEAAKLSEAAGSKSLSRKDAQRVDAIRTDAIHWDDGARAVWKLQGVDNRSSVVLQGLASSSSVSILERKTRDQSLPDLCVGVTFVSMSGVDPYLFVSTF
jgi:hypothetical protein